MLDICVFQNVIEASSAKQLVMETDRATMTETLEDFSARIEKVNTENHDLKNKLQKCDSEIKDWKKTVEELSMVWLYYVYIVSIPL